MQTDETSTSRWVDAGNAYLSPGFTDVEQLYASASGPAVLYRATRLGKRFVLKALKPEWRDDGFMRSALLKEFDLGYALRHPYIAQTLGLEEVAGVGLCIVMEWVEGQTLGSWLRAARPSRRERLREHHVPEHLKVRSAVDIRRLRVTPRKILKKAIQDNKIKSKAGSKRDQIKRRIVEP